MNPPVDETRPGWSLFWTYLSNIARASQESGVTGSRPTKGLWIGRQYYDTTLELPVYVASLNPTVWKDAAGNTV